MLTAKEAAPTEQRRMNDLMTLEDIAGLWKVSRDYAQRYLVKKPEFPDPAPGSTRKSQRWRRQDVERYIQGEEQDA